MGLAKNHALLLEKITTSHPEFRNVKFGAGTGHNGCFVVSGWVETKAELSDLKSIVTNSKPPVFVFYIVQVMPMEQKGSH